MNKILLFLAATCFSFNAFSTVSIDVCTGGTLGEDDFVSLSDGYDNYVFNFHETSFSIPVESFKQHGQVLSVSNKPIVISSEGTMEARVVTIALIPKGKNMQMVYSLGQNPLGSLTLKCNSIDATAQ